MSQFKAGNIVRHTNFSDVLLIQVVSDDNGGHVTGKVLFNKNEGYTLSIGEVRSGFMKEYLRLATVAELIAAGLVAAVVPVAAPRPHAELIKAWADGASIQYFSPAQQCWVDATDPNWRVDLRYRIKPAPKPGPTKAQLEASFDKKMRHFSHLTEQVQTQLRKIERDKKHFIQRWRQHAKQVPV